MRALEALEARVSTKRAILTLSIRLNKLNSLKELSLTTSNLFAFNDARLRKESNDENCSTVSLTSSAINTGAGAPAAVEVILTTVKLVVSI